MSSNLPPIPDGAIAIVGMAGRFPGARSVDALWANIRDAKDCITHFREDELEDAFDDAARRAPNFVKARPVLEDADQFDAAFFGMYPREAALTDPQQRVFLECASDALDDAGYDPARYEGLVGVFAGASLNTYFLKHVLGDRAAVEEFTSQFQVGAYTPMLGALNDLLATRVAYKLGLRGPAISMGACCSTSAVAVAQACQSVLTFQCDMALAGGVSITFPQKRGYQWLEGGIVSPDGRCRPFDAQAGGTVFGHGAGVVLLKRLEDALADGDHIYAVIRGAGVNNDGADKIGLTAPSADGQAEAIAAAHGVAGVDPGTIGYIEAHGTATPLGDPIEFAGLVKAFRAGTSARGFCGLGSVKANVGHLDAAAGVTGLIAAVQAVRHKTRPPLLNYRAPNPQIDLAQSPFFISDKAQPWPDAGAPRRAGVSSFGVGGTNAHLVIEEAPARPALHAVRMPDAAPAILVLSAKTDAALDAMRGRLADRLEAEPALALADVAHTLQVGRRRFERRLAVSARSREEAAAKLRAETVAVRGAAGERAPPVLFMFPGQGAQYPGMGAGLYKAEPLFKEWIDRGAKALEPALGLDIRTHLLAEAPAEEDAPHPIRSTLLAQPALFLVQFATAQLLLSWGVTPAGMLGHSVGELVAAAVAEALSFEDAVGLIAERGRLMADQPPGAMLSVRLSEAELRPLLPKGVAIAAINAPQLCVAAGPFKAIESLEKTLAKRDTPHRRLHTSHAFHSEMMDPVVKALRAVAAKVAFREPTIPVMSCVTAAWSTPAEIGSADYWARHCREPVRFAEGLQAACAGQTPVLVEVGPGRTLATFAGQTLARGASAAVVATLPDHARAVDDETVIADALGRLWCAGVEPLWRARRGAGGMRVALPSYPFERQRHWIDAPPVLRGGAPATAAAPQPAAASIAAPLVAAPLLAAMPSTPEATPMSSIPTSAAPAGGSRRAALAAAVKKIVEDLSGEPIAEGDLGASFLELGFDSLFLGQVAQKVQNTLGAAVTFRQLLGDFPSIEALAAHLADVLPPDAAVAAAPAAAPALAPLALPAGMPAAALGGDLQAVLQAQMAAIQNMLAQQLLALQGGAPVASAPVAPVAAAAAAKPAAAEKDAGDEGSSRFRSYRPASVATASALSEAQRAYVANLAKKFEARMGKSKAATAKNRPVLADPRTVSNFRADWKELVFPIVSARSKGSKIWDVDGNEYVDLVNGYGQTAFGHAPDFVLEAVAEQMKQGFAIGPQTPLAGEVAALFAEMTGQERVTFCNTGSEAVMAAMRVARTVTGRERIVVFANDYHGQFDEVLIKGGRRGSPPRALPVAPGIPPGSVSNMVVLPYGDPESLAWIKANANQLAAVIVEPVQSRHPELRPVAFVKELRAVTEASGTCFVFDEVVTGFRVSPGGCQELWGIKADLATYGKVVGGGLPIGVLAGKARFMDALDGGQWRFGDASVPEVAPTFFAGTFVRHPLVLAAAKAVLLHLKKEGPKLQSRLAERAAGLVERINDDLSRRGISSRAETFSSWFYFNPSTEDHLASLFFPAMRLQGVHVMDGFPCFLTTAHSDADLDVIATGFSKVLDELQGVGVLAPGAGKPAASTPAAAASPPALLEAPLTEPQTEIWLSAQLGDEASCAFNESVTLRFDGAVDAAKLGQALNDVVARHDALRARFSADGERIHFDPAMTVELPVVDFAKQRDPEAALAELLAKDARTAFDLKTGPLFRAQFVTLGPKASALVFTAHHIVCDGWSMNVIMTELAECYGARVKGAAPSLPSAPDFARYAEAQAARGGADAAIEAFWLGLFKDPPSLPELPGDRARPAVKSFAGASYTARIDAEAAKAIKKAGAKLGCTLFATLFGGLQALIGRLAEHEDVVIAVPTAGQSLVEGDRLVGHCVNFLPLRAPFRFETPFGDHLKVVRQHVLDAFERQDYTFGTLVRKLALKRDMNRLPLTEIQFNLERLAEDIDFGGAAARFAPNPKAFSNFDMFVNVIEGGDGLRIDVDYNTDVYDEATIARWMGHYRTLLEGFAKDPGLAIADLPLMTPAETAWLVETLNATAADIASDMTVDRLIAAQALRTPKAVAVVSGKAELDYGGLESRANQLARHLRDRGAAPGARVAVAVERTLELPVALLAVLKAGCAYVPIDTAQPKTRLDQILQAAKPSAIIADSDAGAALAAVGAVEVRIDREKDAIARQPKEALEPQPDPLSRSAYIIFTSGSTGAPKGVEVGHRALANFLQSMAKTPGLTAKDTLVSVTTISFDIAGLELFLPLMVGARVVIASREEVRDAFGLVDRIKSSKASVVQATPTLWTMMVEAGLAPKGGLKMLCGGEPLARDLANKLVALGGELWNMYGPTETTIWSSTGLVTKGEEPITIGAPIANTELHVLDARGRLAPVGVLGELVIGGQGLAKGYLDRPELTEAKFRDVSIGGGPPRRLYFTGDVACRRADGSIKLLGRRDQQIKLRGFRIELGDVEAALRTAPGVAAGAAAVRGRDDAAKRLVGYVVAAPGANPAPAQLTAHMAERLPEYMVPGVWVTLEALPQTANGKLDRNALPDPGKGAASSRIVVAPRTAMEQKIAAIWREVLGVDEISVDDKLFALGADSLHMFRIASRMMQQGLGLEARHLLQHPTIAQLAIAAEQMAGAAGRAEGAAPSLQAFRRRSPQLAGGRHGSSERH